MLFRSQAVIPFLDELTPAAQMIGAVNTVVNQNGKLIGYNTDGKGFFMSLPSFVIKGKKMLILGAGGAATAIIVQVVLEGADEIFVFTRKTSFERVLDESLARQIYKHLMNGVSHMLPFVVGGGILIALAFLFDDFTIDPSKFGSNTPLAQFFTQ